MGTDELDLSGLDGTTREVVAKNRVINIRNYMEEHGIRPVDVRQITGYSSAYIAQSIGPRPKRAVSDAFAKKLEDAWVLQSGSLSRDPDVRLSVRVHFYTWEELENGLGSTSRIHLSPGISGKHIAARLGSPHALYPKESILTILPCSAGPGDTAVARCPGGLHIGVVRIGEDGRRWLSLSSPHLPDALPIEEDVGRVVEIRMPPAAEPGRG